MTRHPRFSSLRPFSPILAFRSGTVVRVRPRDLAPPPRPAPPRFLLSCYFLSPSSPLQYFYRSHRFSTTRDIAHLDGPWPPPSEQTIVDVLRAMCTIILQHLSASPNNGLLACTHLHRLSQCVFVLMYSTSWRSIGKNQRAHKM